MSTPNRRVMRMQWKLHKLTWNLSGGRLGRRVIGMPVLELETTGHRSGRPRRILITYVLDGDTSVLFGTNAGADVDPAWVRNLRVAPTCRVRRDGRWRDADAEFVTDDDHARLWQRAVEANSGYAEYERVLTRPVPIVRLVER
jgi:F420H(2)-dependent quinone reductase